MRSLLTPRLLTAVVLVVGTTLVLPGCTGVRSEDAELGAALDRVVAAGAPGVLVVLRVDGTRQAESRGFAELEGSRELRPEDRFRVGSVTKTFVAALVLRLAQGGRVGLEDTVDRWLPGLLPRGRTITVRQLLSHSSGLDDYVEDEHVRRDLDRRWKPEELVSVALAHPLDRAPGRSFAYSSTNYIVLGLIAERAGNAPLGSQLRARLFEPLGLRHTSFVPGRLRGPHVHGHRSPSHQGVVTGAPNDVGDEPAWTTWAAGAVVSTADDLQLFFDALLRGRVVSRPLLHEMETLVPAGRLRYGLGLAVFPTPCGPAWGHTGNVHGTITVAWNTRNASRQLVLVVNTYPLSPELDSAVQKLELEAFCAGA